MMYFCHYTFEASQHPKFLQAAIDMLLQAEGMVFRDAQDVEVLAIKARQALEKAKPKGNTSRLDYSLLDSGEITIYVYSASNLENSVGRAIFKPVRKVVTFSTSTQAWKELKIKWFDKIINKEE